MQQLDIWFKPWEYTHFSWIQDSIFASCSTHELKIGYLPWCKHIGIKHDFTLYQTLWVEKYWRESDILVLAINLLGSMVTKQKDDISNPTLLRWAQQTSLARPIIINENIKFNNNFEAGINFLYQIIQCYCSPVWTRFLLQIPKNYIENSHIYNQPIINGKMILIIEKLWNMILKKIE